MPTLDRTRSCNAIRSLTATLDDDLLLETLPVGMYACDANGSSFATSAAAALWGREPRLGETDERFCGSYRLLDLDGKHIPSAECPMATALATGRSYRDERIQIERPDGSRIVALVNIEVLKNAHGQVMGAVNAFRDSGCPGQGRRQTGYVADVEVFLRSLPAALYTTDPEGRITFYNEAAAEMWGVRPEMAGASSVAPGSSTGPMGRLFRMTNAPWRWP